MVLVRSRFGLSKAFRKVVARPNLGDLSLRYGHLCRCLTVKLAVVVGCFLFFTYASYRQWNYYTKEFERGLGLRPTTNTPPTSHKPSLDSLVVKKGGDLLKLPRKVAASFQDLVETNSDARVQESQDNTQAIQSSTEVQGSRQPSLRPVKVLQNAAIIVFCYNRVAYLNRTLASLSELPGLGHFVVYVSQDGDHDGVASLINDYLETRLKEPNTKRAEHWQRERIPQLSPDQPGHAWLTQHYKWGLNRVFLERNHSHAIILEDDMIFSRDFLALFTAAAPMLDQDPTLWCISSWNDNGLAHLGWRSNRLFRTSYFPGLGWMLRQKLWQELGPKFPLQAWDHWMRLDSTAKGRECVSPEVNRNKNIGERGTNIQRSVFKRYIAQMTWHDQGTEDLGDLSYLLLPNYQAYIQGLIESATTWTGQMSTVAVSGLPGGQVWLIPYKGEDYSKVASAFRIWPSPRGHHHNLAIVPYRGSTFLLADQRFSMLLPEALRIFASTTLQAIPGLLSEDCHSVCRGVALTCEKQDFWFINTCKELKKHFPCERGCAMEVGPDLPNYVVGANLSTYQTCLIMEGGGSTCQASHKSTRRLCPCVQKESI